jgi:hypothetical protein
MTAEAQEKEMLALTPIRLVGMQNASWSIGMRPSSTFNVLKCGGLTTLYDDVQYTLLAV